ncbi:MAG: hypothetical protein PHY54_20900 [Methylococcales bacterium]|nr:hypothetical protein [Methylococcales bacterium]
MSRRRRHKQSTAEDLLDLIFELTGMFWQIGAVVSAVLILTSLTAFDWADDQYAKALSSTNLGQLAQSYGLVFYLIPLMIAGIAIILGLKSLESYRKDQF